MNPNRELPPWLSRNPRGTTTNQKRAQRYYIEMWLATPPWATRQSLEPIYAKAAQLRAAGHAVEVDHIVPINAVDACGLHCAANLQIISRAENQHKSNNHYPGMPCEILDLFAEPEQYALF